METKSIIIVCMLLGALLTGNINAFSQLKGDHILGDAGLQAGTQAPPSITIAVPVYNYHTSKYLNSDKTELSSSPDVNMFLVGLGASIVTDIKILKANYGATLLFAFASNKIDGNMVHSSTSLAFTDMYVQPLQLGWKTKHADFVFGYALYIPTGKYAVGGTDNAGMGMWSNEISAGSTVYFDKKKTFNFSTLLSYALNSKKKDSEIKTGNVLSIEGGLGKTFYKSVKGLQVPRIFNVGMVYYMQFKTTSDKIPVGQTTFYGDKDHIYALGAEANTFFPKLEAALGVRWLGELGAKNRFQGNTWFVTLGKIINTHKHKTSAKPES